MQLWKGSSPNLCPAHIHAHTRRGGFEDCDVVGCAGEDGAVVVDVVDVHGHREVRHALLQRFVKLRPDLFLREWKRGGTELTVGLGGHWIQIH